MRQFGGVQDIPPAVSTYRNLHKIDLRERGTIYWANVHLLNVVAWIERRDRIIHNEPAESVDESVTPCYIEWYRNITRRYISTSSAMDSLLVSVIYVLFTLHISNFMLFNLYTLLSYTD